MCLAQTDKIYAYNYAHDLFFLCCSVLTVFEEVQNFPQGLVSLIHVCVHFETGQVYLPLWSCLVGCVLLCTSLFTFHHPHFCLSLSMLVYRLMLLTLWARRRYTGQLWLDTYRRADCCWVMEPTQLLYLCRASRLRRWATKPCSRSWTVRAECSDLVFFGVFLGVLWCFG